MIRRASIGAALMLAMCARSWAADMLQIGAQTVPLPAPVKVVTLDNGDQEFLAPILPFLDRLNMAVEPGTDDAHSVTIIPLTGERIVFTPGLARASTTAEQVDIPVAPELVPPADEKGEPVLWVPVRALARLANLYCGWDEATHTLRLLPWLNRVWTEEHGGRVLVLGQATGPFSAQVKRLDNPPRVFIDCVGVAIDPPKQDATVGLGNLTGLRVAQNSQSPQTVRIVADLQALADFLLDIAPDGTAFILHLPKTGTVLPGDALPFQPARLIELSALTYEPSADGSAEFVLATSESAAANGTFYPDTSQLVIEVPNARSAVTAPVQLPEGGFVQAVSLSDDPDSRTVRLTVKTKDRVMYAIRRTYNQLRIRIGQLSLKDLTIVIDPGHGGPDQGAVGRNGLLEKDVNLDIGLRLKALLEEAGAKVVMTRVDDTVITGLSKAPELAARVALAHQSKADLYVSVHNNSSVTPNERAGTETYYTNEYSRRLAQVLEYELSAMLKSPARGVFQRGLFVTRHTLMPAALVEVAYLNSDADSALLADPEYRQLAAQGIFNGIVRYVTESHAGEQ